MPSSKYEKNKTTELFRKLDKFTFIGSSINYWVDDNGITDTVLKAYKNFFKLVNVAVVLFIVAEFGAFFTQNDLTEKQKADRLLHAFPDFIIFSFTLSLEHHKEIVTEVLFILAVELKKDFNDEDTERKMLKRTRFYVCAFVVLCSNALIFYGIDGLYQVFFSDGTFVTIITVWPEVHDRRAIAGVARFGIYVIWWLWILRVTTAYLLVIIITISLSHQYMNLQMYFKSIAGIFEERISQSDKEKKFEEALKVGIRMHVSTMWCTQQVQKLGGSVFSGHIIANVGVLVMLMSQLQNSDRTLSTILTILATATAYLFATGVIMWNAGDITVEAANLPTAIFLSGWQNCTNHSSYCIRRMLLIALAQSQKPVVLKSCKVMELSYQSYVSIVKTSYSIFSVTY